MSQNNITDDVVRYNPGKPPLYSEGGKWVSRLKAIAGIRRDYGPDSSWKAINVTVPQDTEDRFILWLLPTCQTQMRSESHEPDKYSA